MTYIIVNNLFIPLTKSDSSSSKASCIVFMALSSLIR